jgi:hypothetical protein
MSAELTFTDDPYNKAIELKVEDKAEFFSQKLDESSFT